MPLVSFQSYTLMRVSSIASASLTLGASNLAMTTIHMFLVRKTQAPQGQRVRPFRLSLHLRQHRSVTNAKLFRLPAYRPGILIGPLATSLVKRMT
ncbi:hypothetical protein D9601_02385 [Sphingomonas sp. MA1305]|nr:hypothetical protein [Sphingomonas sp. MA1305]